MTNFLQKINGVSFFKKLLSILFRVDKSNRDNLRLLILGNKDDEC